MAREAGVSIVAARSLDSEVVTVDVVDAPADEVLGMVARRLGVQLTRVGSIYYVGDLRPEDLGILVRRVGRLRRDEVVQAVSVLRSTNGNVQCFPDGLLVMGDRAEVLRRVDEMLERIEAAETATWAIQVHLVGMSAHDMREFGFDVAPTLEAAATLASASGALAGMPTGNVVEVKAGLDSVLQAVRSASRSRVLAEPVLLVEDGQRSSISLGQTVPVPRKSVSDQGTVQTTGFESIEAGLAVTVGVREVNAAAARVELEVTDSQVTRFVENTAPVLDRQRLACGATCQAGGLYLVGGLRRQRERESTFGALALGVGREWQTETVLVFVRVERLPGPAGVPSGVAGPGVVSTVGEWKSE